MPSRCVYLALRHYYVCFQVSLAYARVKYTPSHTGAETSYYLKRTQIAEICAVMENLRRKRHGYNFDHNAEIISRLTSANLGGLYGSFGCHPRQNLGTIGYSLMAVAFMDMAYLMWEVFVGQWVMASLQQTTSRLNTNRNASLCLLRSRLLVVWVLIGSMFFVLTVLMP